MKYCETCYEDKKTKKATIKSLTPDGWITETLDMCEDCIESEKAIVKVIKRRTKSTKKAA